MAQFQSTLPQGERLTWIFPVISTTYFNPRSRKGSGYKELGL